MDQSPEHDPFADDGPFGGPIDPDAADDHLALAPPPSAAAAGPRFSWQCKLDLADPNRCVVDVPGSIDFPQHGDGTCSHGALAYRMRRPA
ncbi:MULTISPECIES: hypothetical protein [unclassified Streptomyces]|uniref:hypothetical protein n=1 Tax=unclassified Streptomyces TaxID=2593676 RepID=UPI003655BEE0